jgi:F-type H+-transporting ATPase subunit alpha
MLIYAGSRGHLDNVAVKDISRWEHEFTRYMDTAQPDVGKPILETGAWNDEIESALRQAIIDFNATWSG